jgi:SPP1 gp7 family putative phage head morphogenesis protein
VAKSAKLTSIPEETAAERAAADSVRRALYALRLANAEARRAVGRFNREVAPHMLGRGRALLDRWEALGSNLGSGQVEQVAALGRTLRLIMGQSMTEEQRRLVADLTEFAAVEVAATSDSIQSVIPDALQVSYAAPSDATLLAIAQGTTFHGDLLGGWVEGVSDRVVREYTRELNFGMAAGETGDQIIRRIRGTVASDFEDGVLGGSRREIEALVRSSVRHVGEQARRIVYAANADLVTEYQWVATLDTRTCPTCGPLDGQTFAVDRGPLPPAHFNCRCTTTPVLASGKALGLPPATRASMDGQVPESLRYQDWLEGQPASVQDEILGPARARLLRSGEAELGDFTDDRGRLLNLDELKKLIGS